MKRCNIEFSMPKLYLNKIEVLDNILVWQVDGKYVRENIDREFTNFGQHFRFRFIPKYEFWLDKEYSSDETHFFVDHLFVEWHLMSKGISYDKALEKADEIEKNERLKSKIMQKVKTEVKKYPHSVPKEIYKKKLRIFSQGLDVWIVSGEAVRDLYFIDYTEGGHHFIYEFIPLKEIWIDDDLNEKERKFVILHELHERYLMSKGANYSKAHMSSSCLEFECRHHPSKLRYALEKELENNLPAWPPVAPTSY